MFMHPLHRLAIGNGKGGAQRRVAVDELLKGPLQGRDIEFGSDAHRAHEVTHGVRGGRLEQGPKRPLTIGNRVLMHPPPFERRRRRRLIIDPSANVRIERAFGLMQGVGHMARDGVNRWIVPHQRQRQ